MDIKQINIYHDICRKNHISYTNTFIQHRNLKEFRNFFIERINPNHIIYLYGKLKRPYIKDRHYNKVIKVGEILLPMVTLFIFNSYIFNACLNIIASYFLLSIFIEYIIDKDFEGIFYAYWNSRFAQFRKNNFSCEIC